MLAVTEKLAALQGASADRMLSHEEQVRQQAEQQQRNNARAHVRTRMTRLFDHPSPRNNVTMSNFFEMHDVQPDTHISFVYNGGSSPGTRRIVRFISMHELRSGAPGFRATRTMTVPRPTSSPSATACSLPPTATATAMRLHRTTSTWGCASRTLV